MSDKVTEDSVLSVLSFTEGKSATTVLEDLDAHSRSDSGDVYVCLHNLVKRGLARVERDDPTQVPPSRISADGRKYVGRKYFRTEAGIRHLQESRKSASDFVLNPSPQKA